LTTDPDSSQQDKIRQVVINILDAEDLGFSADSSGNRTETERVLHVSFLTTLSTTVSELIAATSHECQRRGTHTAFELNGARYTLGSSPVDSIWRQNVKPADLRPYPLSETQGQTRSKQLLHAEDCLGWLTEEPRPPIFAFIPLTDKFKDRLCLGLRFEPGLPHEVRNGATASTANSSGTARAEILDQACMAINTMVLLADGEYSPVQALVGKMVANTNCGTTLVNRVHQFYLHNPTHQLGVLIGRFGVAPNIRICDLIRGLKEGIRSGFNLDRFRTMWPHHHLFTSCT